MRLICLLSIGFVLGLTSGMPASADTMDPCAHTPTLATLRACVQHARDQGAILAPELAQSLFAFVLTAALLR